MKLFAPSCGRMSRCFCSLASASRFCFPCVLMSPALQIGCYHMWKTDETFNWRHRSFSMVQFTPQNIFSVLVHWGDSVHPVPSNLNLPGDSDVYLITTEENEYVLKDMYYKLLSLVGFDNHANLQLGSLPLCTWKPLLVVTLKFETYSQITKCKW